MLTQDLVASVHKQQYAADGVTPIRGVFGPGAGHGPGDRVGSELYPEVLAR